MTKELYIVLSCIIGISWVVSRVNMLFSVHLIPVVCYRIYVCNNAKPVNNIVLQFCLIQYSLILVTFNDNLDETNSE